MVCGQFFGDLESMALRASILWMVTTLFVFACTNFAIDDVACKKLSMLLFVLIFVDSPIFISICSKS